MGCRQFQHRVHHGSQCLHARHRILHKGTLSLASLQKHQELPHPLTKANRSRVSSRKRKKIAATSSFRPRHQQPCHKSPPTQTSGRVRNVRSTTHSTSCSAAYVASSNLHSPSHNTSASDLRIQLPVCQHRRHSQGSEDQAQRPSNQRKVEPGGIVYSAAHSWRTSGGRALYAVP